MKGEGGRCGGGVRGRMVCRREGNDTLTNDVLLLDNPQV